MYTVNGRDRVVEVDGLPKMDVGAPMPVIFGDASGVIVAYFVRDAVTQGPDGHILKREPGGHAFVTFSRCLAYMFSPPNDEAFDGHPLAGRGLGPYRAYRVEDSSWLRQLERMNEVHPQHKPSLYRGYTHYVLAFKERVFECLAGSVSASIVPERVASVLDEFQRLWRVRHEPSHPGA